MLSTVEKFLPEISSLYRLIGTVVFYNRLNTTICKQLSTFQNTGMSSSKVVECVPNFSEGRSTDVIEAISAAIRKSDGCSLLDVDPGVSTNRTVYTFVGSPSAVVQGALEAAKVAFQLIDMTKQHGTDYTYTNIILRL